MELIKFITEIQPMIDSDNKTPLLSWIDFACSLADNCQRPLSRELDEIFKPLSYIKANFDNTVLQNCLNMQILGTELINAAVYLNAGYTPELVEEFAKNGKLECGYLPKKPYEKGVFTLIQLKDPAGGFYLTAQESPRILTKLLKKSYKTAIDNNSKSGVYLCNKNLMDISINEITDEKLQKALLHAYKTTSAIGTLLTYCPSTQAITYELCQAIQTAPEDGFIYIDKPENSEMDYFGEDENNAEDIYHNDAFII